LMNVGSAVGLRTLQSVDLLEPSCVMTKTGRSF
jgi:hypothetical protein